MTGTAIPVALDPQALRGAFALHPSGVVAVCAIAAGERVGMAVSSFVPVSLEPALVAICIHNTSSTWPKLLCSEELGISVLGAGHAGAARTLASRSSDRFDGVETEPGPAGALFIAGSPMTLQVSVHDIVAAGDHQLVLLAVRDATVRDGHAPLVFHRSELRPLAR
ncbi:flavin reductase family protein [Hoyosella subflava]|nr:flavin reductase family protein [Hoyosella subflava]